MKYLFTLYVDENYWAAQTPEQAVKELAAYNAFGAEADAAGVRLGGEGLQPSTAAATVTLRGGDRVVTDGPFLETKEQLAGFYLLDCKDRDDALEWAAKIPTAKIGTVEIHPVMDYEAVGAPATADAATA